MLGQNLWCIRKGQRAGTFSKQYRRQTALRRRPDFVESDGAMGLSDTPCKAPQPAAGGHFRPCRRVFGAKSGYFLHPYYSFTISLTFCQWTVASFSFFCGSAAFFRRFDRYLFTFIDSFICIVPGGNFPRRVLSAARSAGPTALLCRRPSKNPAEISFLFAKSMVTSA